MRPGEFLSWWGTQLQEAVPGFLRRRLRRAKTTLTLRIADGTVTFLGPNGMPPFSCALPKEDATRPPAGLDDFLTALPTPLQRVRVELASQEFLRRDFSLPRAARAHLTETVGYQLAKLTPFSAEQMLYACGTAPDASNDGPLRVWLAGVPRHRVARPLALLGQQPPDNPLPLDAPPAPDQPLVFSWQLASTAARSPRRLRLAWIGVFALWIGATGLHLYNRFDMREQLDARVGALRTEAAQTTTLRSHLDDVAAQSAWLQDRKQTTVSSLVVLDSLAQILDDRSWLQRFQLDGDEVSLMVASASPSELIEALESSPNFSDVRFDSLTRDNRNATDRFNIKAKVKPLAQEDS